MIEIIEYMMPENKACIFLCFLKKGKLN